MVAVQSRQSRFRTTLIVLVGLSCGPFWTERVYAVTPMPRLPAYFYPYCSELNGICKMACRMCEDQSSATAFGDCVKQFGTPRCEFRTYHQVTVGGSSTQCASYKTRVMGITFEQPYSLYRTPYGVTKDAWLRVDLGSIPPYCQVTGDYWNPGRLAVVESIDPDVTDSCEYSTEVEDQMRDVKIFAGNNSYIYVSLLNHTNLMLMMEKTANADKYEDPGFTPFTIWLDAGDCSRPIVANGTANNHVLISPFRWAMRRFPNIETSSGLPAAAIMGAGAAALATGLLVDC